MFAKMRMVAEDSRTVLCCIEGVVLASLMHCDLFKINCAPPNLGISRT